MMCIVGADCCKIEPRMNAFLCLSIKLQYSISSVSCKLVIRRGIRLGSTSANDGEVMAWRVYSCRESVSTRNL